MRIFVRFFFFWVGVQVKLILFVSPSFCKLLRRYLVQSSLSLSLSLSLSSVSTSGKNRQPSFSLTCDNHSAHPLVNLALARQSVSFVHDKALIDTGVGERDTLDGECQAFFLVPLGEHQVSGVCLAKDLGGKLPRDRVVLDRHALTAEQDLAADTDFFRRWRGQGEKETASFFLKKKYFAPEKLRLKLLLFFRG